MPRLRQVQDAQLLRAMAHPLRLRLIGALRKDGPATASELARRLGESSGSTSYHLRQLERYGFIEDDRERNGGRERPWRAVDEGMEWTLDTDDAGLVEANRALGGQLVAAERVVVVEVEVVLGQLPEVPGVLVMVEDEVPVERVHRYSSKTSRALASASTRRSTSSREL